MPPIRHLMLIVVATVSFAACSGPQSTRDHATPTVTIPATSTSTQPTPAALPAARPTVTATPAVTPSPSPSLVPSPSPTVTPAPAPPSATPAAPPPTATAMPDPRPATQQVELPDVDAHYSLSIAELRVADGFVRATELVTIREFRAAVPERLYFQVVPAQYGFFELHSMTVAGLVVDPVRLNGGFTLAVDLPTATVAPLEIAIEFTLSVGSEPTGWAGTMLDGNILRLGYWFPVLSTDHGFSDILDPSYTASAAFDVAVTLDPSAVVAHAGDLIERLTLADGRVTHRLRAENVRDFALVVSPDLVLDEATTSTGVRLALYTTAAGSSTRQDILRWSAAAIEQLTELIGPYPYDTFTIVDAGPSMPGGLEFPGLIYINPAYPRLERLIYHEIAHQWFYGVIGTRPLDDGWIDEGGAEFFEVGLPTDFSEVPALPGGGYRYPLDATYQELSGAAWSDAYLAIYEQGARFYYAVLEAMGWDRFWAAMRALYDQHRFGIVTAWDVLLNWQQHSTSDLRPLYAEYFRYDWLDRLPDPGAKPHAHKQVAGHLP